MDEQVTLLAVVPPKDLLLKERRGIGCLLDRLFPLFGVIFPEGMPFEPVIQKNPPQVRMPRKVNAVKIVSLALEPVSPFPDRENRVDPAVLFRYGRPESNPMVVPQGVKMIDHLETNFPLLGMIRIVHAGQVHHEPVIQLGVLSEKTAHLHDPFPPQTKGVVSQKRMSPQKMAGKPFSDLLQGYALWSHVIRSEGSILGPLSAEAS
jgi:hypothetical protein